MIRAELLAAISLGTCTPVLTQEWVGIQRLHNLNPVPPYSAALHHVRPIRSALKGGFGKLRTAPRQGAKAPLLSVAHDDKKGSDGM